MLYLFSVITVFVLLGALVKFLRRNPVNAPDQIGNERRRQRRVRRRYQIMPPRRILPARNRQAPDRLMY